MSQPPQAAAAPLYEMTGQWQAGTPATLKKGENVVSLWRFNVNDDGPAPSNDPVDNVAVTFTAHAGVFTTLPAQCLTESADPAVALDPVSEIQDGGATLVCNLGTRDQGTAELLLTGLRVTGDTGDQVYVDATIDGASGSLLQLPIDNPFAMDIKFDGGSSGFGDGADWVLWFPWSLRHAPGAEAGPSSVSYTITATHNVGGPLQADGCVPSSIRLAEHPFSTTGFPAAQTAAFPENCTLSPTGNPNEFTFTISGIDYSKAILPTRDSSTAGEPLPDNWDVVASGLLEFRFEYKGAGTASISADGATYEGAVTGVTFDDDLTNNENARPYVKGTWTGGWWVSDVGLPGTIWADTSSAYQGSLVRAVAGVRASEAADIVSAGSKDRAAPRLVETLGDLGSRTRDDQPQAHRRRDRTQNLFL